MFKLNPYFIPLAKKVIPTLGDKSMTLSKLEEYEYYRLSYSNEKENLVLVSVTGVNPLNAGQSNPLMNGVPLFFFIPSDIHSIFSQADNCEDIVKNTKRYNTLHKELQDYLFPAPVSIYKKLGEKEEPKSYTPLTDEQQNLVAEVMMSRFSTANFISMIPNAVTMFDFIANFTLKLDKKVKTNSSGEVAFYIYLMLIGFISGDKTVFQAVNKTIQDAFQKAAGKYFKSIQDRAMPEVYSFFSVHSSVVDELVQLTVDFLSNTLKGKAINFILEADSEVRDLIGTLRDDITYKFPKKVSERACLIFNRFREDTEALEKFSYATDLYVLNKKQKAETTVGLEDEPFGHINPIPAATGGLDIDTEQLEFEAILQENDLDDLPPENDLDF